MGIVRLSHRSHSGRCKGGRLSYRNLLYPGNSRREYGGSCHQSFVYYKSIGKNVREMSWKEAAGLIKSWNFTEASIGAAAINAYYNQQESLKHLENAGKITMLSGEDTFLAHKTDFRDKKVATIGHFRYAEEYLKESGTCIVLEREPGENDYPDTACEFLLEDMEYVFITGFTLVNKTLPRLLQLARNSKIILVGPSIPWHPGFLILVSMSLPEL